ncbi:MAG: hypothetical protein HC937_04170, partial [Aquincola sp.]|nr:hypothetical protein [Aquincola sp.]
MTLFSAPHDPWSHRVRIVLAEKGLGIEIVSVTPGRFPEDLLDLMQLEPPTLSLGVPTIWMSMIQTYERALAEGATCCSTSTGRAR